MLWFYNSTDLITLRKIGENLHFIELFKITEPLDKGSYFFGLIYM